MNYGNRKRRQEANITTRLKQPRGNVRPQIEDVLPFECPQLDSISPEIKHYINELEREFIERYNILISNRIIYGEITENISSQLDSKGLSPQMLAQSFSSIVIKDSIQEDPPQL